MPVGDGDSDGFSDAPTEATMGDVQRILYLHVSVAWCGLAACLAMGACGALYLIRRRLAWDHSVAGCGRNRLAVRHADAGHRIALGPRGLGCLVDLGAAADVLAGTVADLCRDFLVRAELEDPHRRARVAAVLAILAVADLPMVVMATRWFRGVHPVAPEMDPAHARSS